MREQAACAVVPLQQHNHREFASQQAMRDLARWLAWLALAFGFGYFAQVKTHWPMAVVMVFGSVVAGSTPMGGGTVSFPFLVLVFGQPPNLGRNFGLAIQALGMTSAMIFILARRTPIQARMLIWSVVGAAVGLVTGTFWIAPLLPSSAGENSRPASYSSSS